MKKNTPNTVELLLSNGLIRRLIFIILNIAATFVFLFGLIAFWAAWDTAQELWEKGYIEQHAHTVRNHSKWTIRNQSAQDGGPGIGFRNPSDSTHPPLVARIPPEKAWVLFVGTGALVGTMASGAAMFLVSYRRKRKAALLGLTIFVVSGWLAVSILLIVGHAWNSGKEFLATVLVTAILELAANFFFHSGGRSEHLGPRRIDNLCVNM